MPLIVRIITILDLHSAVFLCIGEETKKSDLILIKLATNQEKLWQKFIKKFIQDSPYLETIVCDIFLETRSNQGFSSKISKEWSMRAKTKEDLTRTNLK